MVLAERVFFMNKATIQSELKKLEPGSKLIIDASDTVYIDQDVLDVFKDFETNAKFTDIEVERDGFVAGKGIDRARVRRLNEQNG